jgi:hypothetical protein
MGGKKSYSNAKIRVCGTIICAGNNFMRGLGQARVELY